jgi:hypothetical protein
MMLAYTTASNSSWSGSRSMRCVRPVDARRITRMQHRGEGTRLVTSVPTTAELSEAARQWPEHYLAGRSVTHR